ncbi:MAG TPA: PmoA family protein [Humisphaera sp.]|nr:PmoA family protein [Humisphaera sp.]
MMMNRHAIYCVILIAGLPAIAASAAEPVLAPAKPLLLSVPIDVTELPANAEYVVASCPLDFGRILQVRKAAVMVDEHSIRLFHIGANGVETEEPVQFSPTPQARLKDAKLLPDTSPAVSYRGEFSATEAGPRSSGMLTWIAHGTKNGAQRFRLEFAIPRSGRMVQVPFLPQNFRTFRPDGSATPIAQFPTMQLHPQWPFDSIVNMNDGEKLLTTYHIGPTTAPTTPGEIRRPFFYPVIGPDGIPLTDFGKPHDPTGSHRHHYSLWIAHHDVGGKDFWGEQGGAIVNEQLTRMEDGPIFCRIVQKTRWIFDHIDMMHERRTMTAYKTPDGFRLLDIEMEFTPAGKEPVILGKTTFGFLSARVAQSMNVFDGGGEIVNSNGDRNENGAHLKHGDWIDQSGPIAPGKWGGIAIFDSPQNLHHPTGFHCRNDGWACASFNIDQAYTLEAAKPLDLKYRVLLHRGDSRVGEISRRYEEYVATPKVAVGP